MPDTASQAPATAARTRVALISSGLGFVARGIETWMTELAVHLPDSLEVELWSGGTPPAVPRRATRALRAVKRDAALLRPFSWHRRYTIEQLSALPRAIQLLRRADMDVAYCGDPVLSWHLKRFQRLHAAKVVFMNGMRLSPHWARAFDGVQLLAPAYLAEARRQLGEAACGHFFVTPHFVDTGRFQPADAAQRAAARKALQLPPEAFVVLNVGPVGTVSGKRLDWLAAEAAAASERTVLLSVGGDEEGAARVHALAKAALGARFQPLGPQPRDRMKLFYHAADVYALAALAEPFSIALLEALACGLPVVHHAFEVTSWITASAGLAVSMTEQGAAAAALRELANQPGRRAQLGATARAGAVDRFSAPVVCEQLAAELAAIARGQPSPSR